MTMSQRGGTRVIAFDWKDAAVASSRPSNLLQCWAPRSPGILFPANSRQSNCITTIMVVGTMLKYMGHLL